MGRNEVGKSGNLCVVHDKEEKNSQAAIFPLVIFFYCCLAVLKDCKVKSLEAVRKTFLKIYYTFNYFAVIKKNIQQKNPQNYEFQFSIEAIYSKFMLS